MNKKLKLWELNRVSEEEFREQSKFPIVLVLDSIRSLSNVGSFFRTADAFNIEKIYLCGITASPPHREIQKTALGATETVAWEHRENIVDLIHELKKNDYQILSIEQTETTTMLNHANVDSTTKYALVLGNEVNGVDQEVIDLSDNVIEVPQFGTKHSINVSVCAGIVIWEFAKAFITD